MRGTISYISTPRTRHYLDQLGRARETYREVQAALESLALDARNVGAKAARRLALYQRGVLLKSYAVSLGPDPISPKWREGDGRTPEGEYRIDYRKADSSFHRALHISYPGPKDIAVARAHGVSPGGLVMIHGTKNGLSRHQEEQLPADWTNGCVAVTDREIDEIWRMVPDGTRIIFEP